MKRNDDPIELDYVLNASPEEVWYALTDHSRMIRWYFDNIPEFKAEVGFETAFMVENPPRKFTHHWVVTEVVPGEKISYEWTFTEWKGKSVSRFIIEPGSGGTCVLHVIVEVLEDFNDGILEFERNSCIGGWNYFIGERLKGYLE